MVKRYEYIYEVTPEGWGHFPLDMLRYDGCIPVRETDSANIRMAVLTGRRPDATAIRLRGPKPPTIARWKSFGWTLVAEPDKQVAV